MIHRVTYKELFAEIMIGIALIAVVFLCSGCGGAPVEQRRQPAVETMPVKPRWTVTDAFGNKYQTKSCWSYEGLIKCDLMDNRVIILIGNATAIQNEGVVNK
jgi:hypothetical protein